MPVRRREGPEEREHGEVDDEGEEEEDEELAGRDLESNEEVQDLTREGRVS